MRVRPSFPPFLMALVLGSGIVLGACGSSGSSNPTDTQTAELTSIQSGCQQWLRSDPAASGAVQWCTEMTHWMSTYMGSHGLGPQAMWGEPSSLATTCERWMSESPPSGAPPDTASWCRTMASWMNTNVGHWSGRPNWGDWMDHGPMMMGGAS